MTEHFNFNKVPGWSELSETERWHAGYCARKLDDSQLVNEWRYGCATMVSFTSLSDDEKFDAWLAESLLVALTSQDRVVALRSMFQACSYYEKATHRSYYSDTMTVAKLRIEEFVREVVS